MMAETVSFKRRVQLFLEEKKAIQRLMRDEGRWLVENGIRQYGGLRKLARKTGLSPTYLAQVRNGKTVLSIDSYMVLEGVNSGK